MTELFTILPVELRSEYGVLQQTADFALWKARELNANINAKYAAHLAGEASAPSTDELKELAAASADAEVKYRALRTFLRINLIGRTD